MTSTLPKRPFRRNKPATVILAFCHLFQVILLFLVVGQAVVHSAAALRPDGSTNPGWSLAIALLSTLTLSILQLLHLTVPGFSLKGNQPKLAAIPVISFIALEMASLLFYLETRLNRNSGKFLLCTPLVEAYSLDSPLVGVLSLLPYLWLTASVLMPRFPSNPDAFGPRYFLPFQWIAPSSPMSIDLASTRSDAEFGLSGTPKQAVSSHMSMSFEAPPAYSAIASIPLSRDTSKKN